MNETSTSGLKPDQKFRAFLEAAPDAIVVVDYEGQIIMVNHLTEKIFGYQREELLGRKIEVLVPERLRHTHIKHRTGYSREPKTRPMGEGLELAGRRKDGSEFPIEISLSPLETEQEKFVISIIRDICPRKRLEAKFRSLLESAPDGIVVVDTLGKIMIVNGQCEKLFGYSKEELKGQLIEILVPNRFKDVHVQFREEYTSHPVIRPMGAGRRLTGRKKRRDRVPGRNQFESAGNRAWHINYQYCARHH